MADVKKQASSDIFNEIMQPSRTSEETVKLYTELAERNDYVTCSPNCEDVNRSVCVVADALAELVTQNRENHRILDVGAGTGHLSRRLRAHGFRNIDGLDPTEKMLERAKEANLYTNYICEFMTEKPLDIEEETYDHVVMSGAFVGGHMPCAALREMIRLLKKDETSQSAHTWGVQFIAGGYCCFNINEEYLTTVKEYRKLDAFIDELQAEEKWIKIERRSYPNHFYGKSGVLYCCKKL